MKRMLALSLTLAVAPVSHAADIEAGKARVAAVCAACHKPLDSASYTFTLKQLAEAK